MKIYYTIIILMLLKFHDAYSQEQQRQMEGIFEGLSTSALMNVLASSDTADIALQAFLAFKIPMYHPLLKSCRINSTFGNRIHPIFKKVKFHSGIDMAASLNQSVYATADGEVVEVGYQSGLGNYIRIKHLLGFETIYGHLNGIIVRLNDSIYQGQTIGFCGSTGNSTGIHLHYSILRFKRFINPLGMM